MSVGSGRALGVSQSKVDIDGGTIRGVTLTSSTVSGNSQTNGTIRGITALGTTSAATIGFFGITSATQPANAAQAALTAVTGSTGGIGFTTTTGFSAFIAQLENIRASLVLLGLLKGSA